MFVDVPQILPEISLGGGRYEENDNADDTLSTEISGSTENTATTDSAENIGTDNSETADNTITSDNMWSTEGAEG